MNEKEDLEQFHKALIEATDTVMVALSVFGETESRVRVIRAAMELLGTRVVNISVLPEKN